MEDTKEGPNWTYGNENCSVYNEKQTELNNSRWHPAEGKICVLEDTAIETTQNETGKKDPKINLTDHWWSVEKN